MARFIPVRGPLRKLQWIRRIRAYLQGADFSLRYAKAAPGAGESESAVESAEPSNPLRDYFDAHDVGPGIYKWLHYFEVYDRHLSRFVGKDVHILEIGVYSGGSLEMWRNYFGPGARITGVDVEPACKCYENEYTRIVIGDQEDRAFWRKFWAESPPVDIVIDDGGHIPEQQRVTLEECLPRLSPGGVYICEDIHYRRNRFRFYMNELADELDHKAKHHIDESRPGYSWLWATPFQSRIHSLHHYPYLAVIETRQRPLEKLETMRRGTLWQPFKF